MKKKVAIIGYGWVGKAMHTLFPDALIYVRDPSKYNRFDPVTKFTDSKDLIGSCDIAFVCVPSPLNDAGRLDISIVEEVVGWCSASIIVLRSTVNPGTCHYLSTKYHKRIVMQPEYLGETVNHPLLDQKKNMFMILGGDPVDRREVIELYTTAYNANISIRQVTALEAEVIKLSENRAIAFKVMQAQELYDACQAAGVDYYQVRDAVYGDDPRFNLWFTFIYPEKRGFNSSKCLVKDVPAWASWAKDNGIDPTITNELVRRSNEYAK